ncbi:MAG TPA: TonB-dependent receptor [Candidatus Omnitrophota bacterium]|nr:TonB-dependent receptor [Candidatus Omnitrophota bacterium]HQO38690.1 TonB-dependent receptor [Candidatus Omnitrophota bacterium]HQQ06400.1 TonB-dependent receptor [Candidatus Omnitrophota bacterium]
MGQKSRVIAVTLVSLAAAVLFSHISHAQDDIGLDRIVVTPYRYADEVHKAPAAVTIIGQAQIQASNAQTIPDLLRSQTGVVVRDWYGNGTKVSADIRAFGEQAPLNTVVLIDGRRINEVDISGADWTQIPLNQVEKIEILRGSSGAVLYGDNASGGVINIITKKGSGKPVWNIEAQAGSYDLNKQMISVNGSEKDLSYYVSASRDSTHGYRENSHYKARDFASRLNYDIDPEFAVRLHGGLHYSDYGLPGELSDAEIITLGRRASKYGDDFARDRDWYLNTGATKICADWGKIDLDLSYRSRGVDTFWRVFYGGWGNPIRHDRIDTIGFTPKYILEKNVAGRANTFIAGVDLYRADYASDAYDYSDVAQEFTRINKLTRAFYVQDEMEILNRLYASGGWRHEEAEYQFDYHNAPGTDTLDSAIKPSKKAYNAGLVWRYRDESSIFGNASRSFRFPATDEYSLTWPSHGIDTTLKPQETKDYEIGIKHRFGPKFKADMTLFRMNIEHELYYDYASYSNKNYDRTRHEGVEAGIEAGIGKDLVLTGNYAYTRGLFRGGAYDKRTIPMVPRNKGSVGLKYRFAQAFTLNLTGNYVGERYFINDQANALSRLNGFFTADASLSYVYKDLTTTIGVNNILGKEYAEYATCNPTTGKKVYYPSPARSFTVKLAYKF